MPILKQIGRLAAIVPSGVMAAAGNIPGSFLDLVSFLVFPACRTKTSVIRRATRDRRVSGLTTSSIRSSVPSQSSEHPFG
jgi:hypothetical protein